MTAKTVKAEVDPGELLQTCGDGKINSGYKTIDTLFSLGSNVHRLEAYGNCVKKLAAAKGQLALVKKEESANAKLDTIKLFLKWGWRLTRQGGLILGHKFLPDGVKKRLVNLGVMRKQLLLTGGKKKKASKKKKAKTLSSKKKK